MTRRMSPSSLARIAVVAGFVGAAACGGKSPVAPATPPPTPPPTTLPAPTTRADLSAKVTSPESGHTFGCRDDVHFRIDVTNAGPTVVAVSGVRKHTTVVRGGCDPSSDFTYTVRATAYPRTTTTIADRPVYGNGSGCCHDAQSCGGMCTIQQAFVVVTALGEVPAGDFEYQVLFDGCHTCSGIRASSGEVCRADGR